jgi:NADH-quinone oxidoreductase subunit F
MKDPDQLHRVLDPHPVATLGDHLAVGGGRGLDAAMATDPLTLIEVIEAAGLRGRGGAGFPTGIKWRAVADNRSPAQPSSVVVNAAEGEPGTFKDRAILRCNPFRVLEGALIAARAVGADAVVVGMKASFTQELARVRAAIEEIRAHGLAYGIELFVVEGPSEYLFGEETALLEVIDGRGPFPRIAPPYRSGLDSDPGADGQLAGPSAPSGVPPTLANNVETLANVPAIVANGPDWFRQVGTADSPGTVVCTVTGRVRRHGVAEVAMGTPLADVIRSVGGGPLSGQTVIGAVSGVANAVLPAGRLDTPLSYEAMSAVGSGLGAAGFIVLDDATDVISVAHAMARFLAVESCGQCAPCKADGLAIAELLDGLRLGQPEPDAVERIIDRTLTVTDGARCYLAHQQADVVSSFLRLFPEEFLRRDAGTVLPATLEIAPIVDIVEGRAVLDRSQASKQPDWTHDDLDSGEWPADRRETVETPVASPVVRVTEERPVERSGAHDGDTDEWHDPGALDPVKRLVAGDDRIERLLAELAEGSSADRRPALLERLATELRERADITERVLYPMALRHAAEDEDEEAVSLAWKHMEEAVGLADELVEQGSDPDDTQLSRLAGRIAAHLSDTEQCVLPLLRARLSDDDLERLDAALAEAAARSGEP